MAAAAESGLKTIKSEGSLRDSENAFAGTNRVINWASESDSGKDCFSVGGPTDLWGSPVGKLLSENG